MQQTLLVVVLLIAAASAALPRAPNANITTRGLNNPLGPNERRIFFKNQADCSRIFDTWELFNEGGATNCYFTEYCNIDPNIYTGLPYLYVSPRAETTPCRIVNWNGNPADNLDWVAFRSEGFLATFAQAESSTCHTVHVHNLPTPYPNFNAGQPPCENGQDCYGCSAASIANLDIV